MSRTKSLLFDDDVIDTFGGLDHIFSLKEIIAAWQDGRASTVITRKAISQALAALATVNNRNNPNYGATSEQLVAALKYLVKTYPELYARDETDGLS